MAQKLNISVKGVEYLVSSILLDVLITKYICLIEIHSAILNILTFRLFDMEKLCERYYTLAIETSTRDTGMYLFVYYFCIRVSE